MQSDGLDLARWASTTRHFGWPIRAALAYQVASARIMREHHDLTVLLPVRICSIQALHLLTAAKDGAASLAGSSMDIGNRIVRPEELVRLWVGSHDPPGPRGPRGVLRGAAEDRRQQ